MPTRDRGLRAGAVALAPGDCMDWHSTRGREELLIALSGAVRVEIDRGPRPVSGTRLRGGDCLWLPRQTRHRVVNASKTRAHYVYVTGAA